MIQLLFWLVSAEVLVVALLLVRTPLQKLAVYGFDGLKEGRGSVVVRAVTATVIVVLLSSVHRLVMVRRRLAGVDGGGVAGDSGEVICTRHLLQASLLGFSLLLLLIIGRVHHCIRENHVLRKSMKAIVKQKRMLEEKKSDSSEEIKAMEKELANSKVRIAELELEAETRTKEVKTAEESALALRKQSEGFLLEYDRLLEDNQSLRSQLQTVDRKLSRTESRKLCFSSILSPLLDELYHDPPMEWHH